MPRRWLVATLACGLVVFTSLLGCAAGMSSRFLDVGIEVFRPLGLLDFGWFEPLGARFLAMDIGNLAKGDAASLAQALKACGASAPEPAVECTALRSVDYTFTRRYAAQPILGATYRIVLTNRTDAALGVALVIDGLNTNGGAAAAGTSADRKWILAPRQTVRISGWQVSTDEALAFRFETPSHSQATDASERGVIRVGVYLPLPEAVGSRGTGAGSVIGQPTVLVPFESATEQPVDVLEINYARSSVPLGILCGETGGVGVRITQVVAGTIAELRGLKAGDVVTHVNAVAVNTCGELSAYLSGKKPGDRVVLKVHRDDRDFLLTLELEE